MNVYKVRTSKLSVQVTISLLQYLGQLKVLFSSLQKNTPDASRYPDEATYLPTITQCFKQVKKQNFFCLIDIFYQ